MSNRPPASVGRLYLLMALVVTAFVGVSALGAHDTATIDEYSDSIATNAAPSIERNPIEVMRANNATPMIALRTSALLASIIRLKTSSRVMPLTLIATAMIDQTAAKRPTETGRDILASRRVYL